MTTREDAPDRDPSTTIATQAPFAAAPKKNPHLMLAQCETRMGGGSKNLEAFPWNQSENRMEPAFSLLQVEAVDRVSRNRLTPRSA